MCGPTLPLDLWQLPRQQSIGQARPSPTQRSAVCARHQTSLLLKLDNISK